MKQKTIVAIIILAILTGINTVAIFAIDNILAKPQTMYSVEVLGTVFKEENTKSNVIEIDLIRPPRTVVVPGETTYPELTITNTANFDIYLRTNYRIEVRNDKEEIIPGLEDQIKISFNDGWHFVDGYWHYERKLKPGEMVPGLIKSIEYSTSFFNNLHYDVYIPVLVEGVEITEDSEKYWPNKDINKINPVHYIDNNMTWTQSAEIIIQ